MSDQQSAIQDDIHVETEGLDEDADESVVADRQPRAPSLTHLGRYRLVREIASGGMATVNLAVAEGLEKLVALKIIHPHLAQEDSFVRMFLDEARLASSISHRNVCNVFDFGEADGRYYIAMDYLSGQSLRDVLRRLRKTDLQIEPRRLAVYIAYMVAEACEGLHAAHELHGAEGKPLNVVHRDVSPHNLFVTYDGNVSVVDFGIARASDRIQSTATGVLKGKFSYMAPEQMRQLEIDRRADVWALGVVLWESLTLQRLFVRSSQADTVMSVMMDRIRPPSELRPDLPKELDVIALKAIARSPAQRFATARDMGRELMKFCRESGVMVGPIEIENLMERLFSKEIEESKRLLRQAKKGGGESGVWMDVTPSGFSRVAQRSGIRDKGQFTSTSSLSVIGQGTLTSAAQAQNSQAAPAQARGTAHPEETGVAHQRQKRRGLLFGGGALLAAAIVAGGLYAARAPSAAPLAVTPTAELKETGPTVAPGAQAAVQPAGDRPAQPPSAGEPSAKLVEPGAASPTQHPAAARPAAVQRPDPKRDVRARPAARPAANGSHGAAAQRDPAPSVEAAAPARGAPQEEAPARIESAAAAAPAAEPRDENIAPAAAPAAAVNQASQAVASSAPPPAAVASTPAKSAPSAPQRLEAQASIADLDVEGSLGSSIVSRMLARVTPTLKSCYGEAAKKAGRNDFSPLPVSFLIDEGGGIRDVSAGKHGLSDLPACAGNALKRTRSERVPDVGTVKVVMKVTFQP